MTELPEPLTPADCDLRGYDFMPLHGHRLFNSDFYYGVSAEAFRVGLRLWWAAWQQCPAASLPNNDTTLCRLADMGRDLKGWKALKAEALRGFVLCADGRLYHPVIAAMALEAWDRRRRERDRKAAMRAARAGQKPGQDADKDADNGDCPTDTTRDNTRDTAWDNEACPTDKGADKRLRGEERRGEKKERTPSPPSEARPPTATRLPDDWQPDEADRAFAADLGLDPSTVAARFRDHWRAKPGKDGRKADWAATWRNWCRGDAERAPRARQPPASKADWVFRSMAADRDEPPPEPGRLLA